MSLYLLCDVLTTLQVMVSIRKDLRLHNGNNSILGNVKRYLCFRDTFALKPPVFLLQQITETQTCWQMLAYRARTLAFSMMASSEGVVSLIFSTDRHLAKSAPSFLYCAQRSESPSRPAHIQTHQSETERFLWGLGFLGGGSCCLPWVVVSPLVPARGTTPLST